MSISGVGASPSSLTLLPEVQDSQPAGNAPSGGTGTEALPPGAAKILNDGLEAADAAEHGNFVPGLLSLMQSTDRQVQMCRQIAQTECKDTQPGEDKKASNNPTGMG